MNIDDLKPLWQQYKKDAGTEINWQSTDIQLIIKENKNLNYFSRYTYLMMNTSIYLFLIFCTGGC
jgi:lipid-binding SYLF domain-containing protein